MKFGEHKCIVKHATTGDQLLYVEKNGILYPVEFSKIEAANVVVKEYDQNLLWHQRFGHLSFQGMKLLKQYDMVIGLPRMKNFKNCEACVHGKWLENHSL